MYNKNEKLVVAEWIFGDFFFEGGIFFAISLRELKLV